MCLPSTKREYQTERKKQRQQNHSGIGQNSILFVNNCVGDVLLTIGARFSHVGLPCGIILLTITYIHQIFGFIIITRACQYCTSSSLFDLFKKAYNHHFAMFIDICAVIMLYVVLVCYTIIISQYVHQAYQLFFNVDSCVNTDTQCIQRYRQVEMYIRIIVGFFILPIESLITSMKILNIVSSISILFVLVTIIAIVVRFIQTMVTGKLTGYTKNQYQFPSPRIPLQTNIFTICIDWTGMFAMFSLQPIIPPLYNELQGNKKIKKYILTHSLIISATLLFVMYMICGIIGCLMFYGKNQQYFQNDNILTNFAHSDIVMTVVRIIYIFVIALGYPVIVYQIRSSIASWLHLHGENCCQKAKLLVIGIITSVISSLIALFTPSILIIFDPFCCIFGTLLFQIMPLLVWYKLPQLQQLEQPDYYEDFDIDRKLRRSSIFSATAHIMTHRSFSASLQSLNKQITESLASRHGSTRVSMSVSQYPPQVVQEDSSGSSVSIVNYSQYIPAIEQPNQPYQDLDTGLVSNTDSAKKRNFSTNSDELSETDLGTPPPSVQKVKFLNKKARTWIFAILIVIIVGFNGISFYVSIRNIIKQSSQLSQVQT